MGNDGIVLEVKERIMMGTCFGQVGLAFLPLTMMIMTLSWMGLILFIFFIFEVEGMILF